VKLSLEWLSEFVDLAGIATSTLAEELTVHTAEVEGWETLRRNVDGVIVGSVTHAAQLATVDHAMWAVRVNVGACEYETVCAAPNVRVGMKVAFAPPGTKLAGNKLVESATVYSRESRGVLCSAAELGLSTSHEGLLDCPPTLENGTLLSTWIPPEDVLIEIDNKSLTHRPDLWGQYGFAREIAAIFNRQLKQYQTVDLSAYSHLPPFAIEVESAEDCPCYSAIELKVSNNPPSPLFIQGRLHALGLGSINALVDLTNYVQLELGQPTHAFDASGVQRIHVGRSGCPRKFTTLDGITWDLLPEDLLIFNGETPIALAGIMGGESSRIVDGTRRILLESANFKGSRIRLTSVRLPLRTDASLRFEKKLPPLFSKLAVGRILHLMLESELGAEPTTRYSVVGDIKDRQRDIRIPSGYLSKRAGAKIENQTAKQILESIGFQCEEKSGGDMNVKIPPFRSEHDISIPEDISEEVMRLYGYDRITPQIPITSADSVPFHVPTRNQHRFRRVLAEAHRFIEVHTYGWYDEDWLGAIGYRPGPTLNLVNPLGANRRRMRDSLLPNILAIANQNRKMRATFRIYEIGKIFRIDPDGSKAEENELSGISVDQEGRMTTEHHFRKIRGTLDDLAKTANLPELEYTAHSASGKPWIAEGMALSIKLRGSDVGQIGLLPSALRSHVTDGGHAVWFSLRADSVEGEVYPSLTYTPPPVYPGSSQDFTFVWPLRPGYSQLAETLGQFQHRCLDNLTFVDFYRSKGSEVGNYTFRFFIRLVERTLTAEDIQDFRKAFVAFIEQRGLKLV